MIKAASVQFDCKNAIDLVSCQNVSWNVRLRCVMFSWEHTWKESHPHTQPAGTPSPKVLTSCGYRFVTTLAFRLRHIQTNWSLCGYNLWPLLHAASHSGHRAVNLMGTAMITFWPQLWPYDGHVVAIAKAGGKLVSVSTQTLGKIPFVNHVPENF